jgi:precorrin-2/cobalt-factor-2 C20-methyltransferase
MTGRLSIVGLGPGDPELVTLKAARIVGAAPVVAFFAKPGRPGFARTIAGTLLNGHAEELRFDYPFTTEVPVSDPRYKLEMDAFYDASAAALATRLEDGKDAALLCEGDPFLYGSAMYVFDRLANRFSVQIVPGITTMSGCWSRAGTPMVHGDDVLTILPGTLDEDKLATRLAQTDAAVIMKLGRNLPKVRSALEKAGLEGRAVYVERGTMQGECIRPLSQVSGSPAPYFSMVLVPGRQGQR